MANVLPLEKRVDVVRHLVEGASVRGTSRLTDVSLPTVLSTVLRMGEGCDRLHNALVRDLDIHEIECDELHAYVKKRQKNLTPEDPAEFAKKIAQGAPDMDRASTSHVERANLTVRMHIRRFLRRGNAFSKKMDHHRAAVSLHVAWYNFCRVHETLRVAPAMEAGITDRVWSVQELVERALAAEPCAPPEAKPLAPPAPPPGEKPATARELPNGRGWLRVVQGGKSAQNDAPKAPTPPATPVPTKLMGTTNLVDSSDFVPKSDALRLPTVLTEPLFDENGQGLLFKWRPRERQLSLWDDE